MKKERTTNPKKEVRPRKMLTNSSFVSDKKKKGLSAVRVLELNNKIVEYILEGYSRKEIIGLLESDQPGLLKKEYEELHQEGTLYFRDRAVNAEDLKDVVITHLGLYEEIYRKFSEMDFLDGKRKTMYQKEKVLGFHRETNILEINQENTVVEQSPYNLEKLTKEERDRLTQLLTKSRGDK